MKKLSLYILLLLTIFNACGQTSIILEEKDIENAYPRLSKDGKHILYQSNRDGHWQIYIFKTDSKTSKRLTDDQFNNNFPDWSYDNKWIAFVSDRDGNEELYLMRTDGSELRRITDHPARDIHPYFSPDGKYILFNSDRNDLQLDVYRYIIDNGKIERLTNTPENETCARFSPDMKNMVLLKNSPSGDGIYVLNLSNFLSDDISKTPGVYHGWPVYSYDGKWIYYSSMENGTYSIYRISPEGKNKQQLTNALPGEEHARVSISRDNRLMIYNIKNRNAIYIVSTPLNP